MSESNGNTKLYLEVYFRSLIKLEKEKSCARISSNAAAGNYHGDLMGEKFCDKFENLLAINAKKVENSNENVKQKMSQARRDEIHEISTNLLENFRCRFSISSIEIWQPSIIEFFSEEIEKASKILSRNKDFAMQKLEKPDVCSSGSTWDYNMFSNYIEELLRTGCQFTFPKINKTFHLDALSKKVMSNIVEKYKECGAVLCGKSIYKVQSLSPKEILAPLEEFSVKEAAVKEFLKTMLFPILVEVKANVSLEVKLSSKSLPSSICDYVIFSQIGKAIGVIEAKARGKLNDKSVVQCLLQLISLQKQEYSCKDLFGIVTDAYYFIFILLKQKRIMLFADEACKCQLWTNDTWENMENIVHIIILLCQGKFL